MEDQGKPEDLWGYWGDMDPPEELHKDYVEKHPFGGLEFRV